MKVSHIGDRTKVSVEGIDADMEIKRVRGGVKVAATSRGLKFSVVLSADDAGRIAGLLSRAAKAPSAE